MVSLIVCTIERVGQLERLLSSLEQQAYRDFEVLVVDQNSDDRVARVIGGHPELPIRHLHSGRGLSRGRNVALREVRGEIIAFPDDDCWYPPCLLESVITWFSSHPGYVGLFGRQRDAGGNPVGPRLPHSPCRCDQQNILTIGTSSVGFLRKFAADSVGLFNENIGVGSATTYQAGEECDYFLRALERGYNMWFDPQFTIHHPNLHSPERLRRTTYGYALGAAYVLRLHGHSLYFANLVVRSLGGAALSLLLLHLEDSYIYLLRAAGCIRGFVWGPRDLAHQQSHQG